MKYDEIRYGASDDLKLGPILELMGSLQMSWPETTFMAMQSNILNSWAHLLMSKSSANIAMLIPKRHNAMQAMLGISSAAKIGLKNSLSSKRLIYLSPCYSLPKTSSSHLRSLHLALQIVLS